MDAIDKLEYQLPETSKTESDTLTKAFRLILVA